MFVKEKDKKNVRFRKCISLLLLIVLISTLIIMPVSAEEKKADEIGVYEAENIEFSNDLENESSSNEVEEPDSASAEDSSIQQGNVEDEIESSTGAYEQVIEDTVPIAEEIEAFDIVPLDAGEIGVLDASITEITGSTTITASGKYRVSTTLTNAVITIDEVGVELILDGAHINSATSPIAIKPGAEATITLEHGSINSLHCNNSTTTAYHLSAGIHVPAGANLTIKGSGFLECYSGNYGAGIGGGPNQDSGRITIKENAEVHATARAFDTTKGSGTGNAAGIGGGGGFTDGGCDNAGGIIIEDSAIVVAKSAGDGAGVGGGAGGGSSKAGIESGGGNGGSIIIRGSASLSAESAGNGAGIGGGGRSSNTNTHTLHAGDGGTIAIEGNANVNAKSGGNGAAIGGGGGSLTNHTAGSVTSLAIGNGTPTVITFSQNAQDLGAGISVASGTIGASGSVIITSGNISARKDKVQVIKNNYGDTLFGSTKHTSIANDEISIPQYSSDSPNHFTYKAKSNSSKEAYVWLLLDTSALEALIDFADNLDDELYIKDTNWTVMDGKLTQAKELIEDILNNITNADSQDEIDDLTAELGEALDKLVLKADYTAVNDAIADVPADLSLYTDDSVLLQEYIIASIDWNKSNSAADQAIVDKYAVDIGSALTLKPADYKAVDSLIAGMTSELDKYTPESTKALIEAIKSLQSDRASHDRTILEQGIVDAFKDNIEKALNDLKLKTPDAPQEPQIVYRDRDTVIHWEYSYNYETSPRVTNSYPRIIENYGGYIPPASQQSPLSTVMPENVPPPTFVDNTPKDTLSREVEIDDSKTPTDASDQTEILKENSALFKNMWHVLSLLALLLLALFLIFFIRRKKREKDDDKERYFSEL